MVIRFNFGKSGTSPAPLAEHLQKGQDYEAQALRFLESQGLKLIEKNFRCTGGEVDLIMLHGHELVFVEVRYRRNNAFGGAAESIGSQKQRKIDLAAQVYLQQNESLGLSGCRFDVIAIEGENPSLTMEWISDAF